MKSGKARAVKVGLASFFVSILANIGFCQDSSDVWVKVQKYYYLSKPVYLYRLVNHWDKPIVKIVIGFDQPHGVFELKSLPVSLNEAPLEKVNFTLSL